MSISKKRLKEISDKKDENIDYSDIPELDERFWKNAKLLIPKNKKRITIRIDADVLEWFRSQGEGYQTKINSILKTYVKAHSK